jgi:4'-phosphopantetheinyl transferase
MVAGASGVATGVAGQTIDCRVWWIDPTNAPEWCEKLLSEPERARAESFHQVAARRRFTAATALLKVTVAKSAGCDPFDVKLRRECPDCRRLHGRPEVVGSTLNVSISHSGDRVAVALCADGPVGVDVEQVNPDVDGDSMLRFVLGDAERQAFSEVQGRQARLQAFFRCWTRKESVLKATGDGLRIPMSNVTLAAPHDRAQLTGFTNHPELVETARIVDLHPGPGYVGAVTVLSVRPVRVWELDGADAFATAVELFRDGL